MPMKQLCGANEVGANTVAVAATLQMLNRVPTSKKSHAPVKKRRRCRRRNVNIARAGYDTPRRISSLSVQSAKLGKGQAVLTGNQAVALGGVAAGVKFYAACPMRPSTGVLMWMAAHARQLGIMVRQVEDEISVMNMVIGAPTPAAEPCVRPPAAVSRS
jgi:2-oxoglutarate ferredoxin oxidoreductase subunit alpha